jgi:ATP-binding cassette subfamily F protein 3
VIGYTDAEAVSAGQPGGLRVRVPEMEVLRGERIGLIGPNGGGKTTLLRTLIGQLHPLEGRVIRGHNVRIGYYAQTHEHLNPRSTLLDEVRQTSHLSEEGARTYLGRFLFTGDDVFKPVSALSGGERSRLALAKLTLEGANFLVLDEPTNHLDLPSRETLERILSAFDGTLIFVSHDRYFVDALATTLWVLEEGVVTPQRGNYTAYRTRTSQQRQVSEPQRATRQGGTGTRPVPASVAQRSLEGIEAEIQSVEAEIQELERQVMMASEAGDVRRIAELGAAYENAKERLADLYGEWEDLAV